jgi:hypothetical protein
MFFKQAIYFTPTNEGGPKGKLYNKYRNLIATLQKKGLFPKKYRTLRLPPSTSASPESEDQLNSVSRKNHLHSIYRFAFLMYVLIFPEDELNEAHLWLKTAKEPWQVVDNKWNLTAHFRAAKIKTCYVTIDEILNEWPLYRHIWGFLLVRTFIFFESY